MEYVGQVPAPPMPSAHLFVNLGDPVRVWDCGPSVPPALFTDGWFTTWSSRATGYDT